MNLDVYILVDGERVLEPDFQKWCKWFEGSDHKLARDKMADKTVSTVFLGLDHSFGKGPPLFYETAVFSGADPNDGWCEKYETRDEALAGHKIILHALQTAEHGGASP